MNKTEDKQIVQAWKNGYDDFLSYGPETPCPYELDTKESKYWIMGFEDAFDDYRKHPADLDYWGE